MSAFAGERKGAVGETHWLGARAPRAGDTDGSPVTDKGVTYDKETAAAGVTSSH